jgi:hypothetical protein
MQRETHIGNLILQKLKEKKRSISWLAREVERDSSNLGKMLKEHYYIDTELLFSISVALEEDFFAYYSEELQKVFERLNSLKKAAKNYRIE